MFKKRSESRPESGLFTLNFQGALRKSLSLLFLCVFMIIATVAVSADEGGSATSGSVHWWQIVSGIIAIPVALLGGYLTWKQIRNFKKPEANQNDMKVSVMNGASVKDSKVGNIIGIDGSGPVIQAPERNANVSVLSKGQITESEIGDVTGIKE